MILVFELVEGGVVGLPSASSLADSSASLPAGAYTTLRTYGGRRLLHLDRHVARLVESVALQGHPAPLREGAARRLLAESLRRADHPESRVRLTFAPPRLFAAVEALTPLPEERYRDGVACQTVRLHRDNPHAKDTRFIAAAGAASRALPAGVEEGLMLSEEGELLEGLSSNFFAVLRGELRSEDDRVLLGVTRSLVLELAEGLLPFVPRPVRVGDLSALGEAFLTSVSREVLPVRSIDGRPLGDGRPGPITRELLRRFRERVQYEAEPVE
jgi:branched-chain amino acid aminotransferase